MGRQIFLGDRYKKSTLEEQCIVPLYVHAKFQINSSHACLASRCNYVHYDLYQQ